MKASVGMRRDLASGALVLGLAVLLFPGALLHGEAFFERDLYLLDWYPPLAALARCLREGVWPLWDPGIAFGQPLLADPGVQAAYPVSWLALAVPRALSYTLYVLLHLVVAGVGCARLARSAGAGRGGALLAGAVFVLSGPLLSAANLRHHFAGAAWMPWVLLAALRLARAPSLGRTLALSLLAGLQVLAGSADLCAMTWLAGGFWSAAVLVARRRRGIRRPLVALTAAAGLAAGASALVWWPAASLVSRSARHDLPDDVRAAWSVPAAGLLRVMVPLDPDRVPFAADTWERLYDRPTQPFLYSLYLGPLALVLSLAAFARRRTLPFAVAAAATAGVATLFAMGPHGPLYPVAVAVLPPLRIFRYPSKAMLLVALAIAVLAGLGNGALRRALLGRRRCAWAAAALLAAAAISAAVASDFGGGLRAPQSVVLVAGGSLLLALLANRRLGPDVGAAALAALCGADLLAAHRDLNATAPPALVLEPPATVSLVDRSEGRRLYVYDYHSLPGFAESRLGRADPYARAAVSPSLDRRQAGLLALRQYLLPPSGGPFGIEYSYDVDPRGLYPRELDDVTLALRVLEGTPAYARMLRMGAVGTVLSLHTSGLTDLRLVAALPSLFPEPIYVWRVPGSLPRAWLVGCSRPVAQPAALKALTDPGFDPAREVILPEASPTLSVCGEAGRARLIALLSDEVRLEVTAERAAYLVLADAYDPGWRAAVDGTSAPVLRANVAFQAVAVPAGPHRVRLVYRPREVLQGAVVSAVSVLVAVALVLARAAGSRRSGLSPGPGAPGREAPR